MLHLFSNYSMKHKLTDMTFSRVVYFQGLYNFFTFPPPNNYIIKYACLDVQ